MTPTNPAPIRTAEEILGKNLSEDYLVIGARKINTEVIAAMKEYAAQEVGRAEQMMRNEFESYKAAQFKPEPLVEAAIELDTLPLYYLPGYSSTSETQKDEWIRIILKFRTALSNYKK